jgi:hypothetical protein
MEKHKLLPSPILDLNFRLQTPPPSFKKLISNNKYASSLKLTLFRAKPVPEA